MRLTLEPILESSGGLNLRTVTSKPIWEGLRQKTFNEYNNKCAICGSNNRLECHEVWEYNDTDKVQTLTDLVSLCNLCHSVKHLHYLATIPIDVYLDHFAYINQFTWEECINYYEAIQKVYNERCDHIWTISFGDYEPLVDNDKLETKDFTQWYLRQTILRRGQNDISRTTSKANR